MIQRLREIPKPLVIGFAASLIVLAGMADYQTELSVSALYLLAILVASTLLGSRGGVVMSIVAAMVALVTDLTSLSFSQPWLPYWNGAIRLVVFVMFVLVLRAFERERISARHDYLTGLANRHGFFEAAALELLRAQRYQRPLTIVFIDLDGFKAVNDRWGHETGDAVLRLTARTLQATLRATDLAARLGGDEFVLLLPETGSDEGRATVLRLQAAVATAMEGKGWPVSFSAGVVTYPRPPDTVDAMVSRADSLLYAGRTSGRGRIEYEVVPAAMPAGGAV